MSDAARDPGRTRPADYYDEKQKVVVVGDGILGSMILSELVDYPLLLKPVTISMTDIDDTRASDGSLAWLNVVSTADEAYARLRKASMDIWAELARDEFCPVQLRGSLMWDREPEALEGLSAFYNSIGWETRLVGREAFARLAPGIDDPPEAALFAPNEGSAFPPWMMNWQDGAADITARVVGIVTDGDRAIGVRLEGGDVILADHVVIAAGTGTPAILSSVGVGLPMKDAPGMVLWTDPVPVFAKPVLASPGMDFWQDDDGMVVIATGTHQTMVEDLQRSVEAAIARLREIVPSARDVTVREAMIRHRPIPADGLPALGSPAGIENLHVAVCHSGMTLAPIIARIVRAAINGQDPPVDIAPFHIDRFAKGQA